MQLTNTRLRLLIPASLGLAGLLFTVAGLILVHFTVGPHLRSALESDLNVAATQLADKLDAQMFERWRDLNLAAGRQVLRERAGESSEREVVEEIKAKHPRYAWVGFTDEACLVRVSTERSIDGMNVEARPWCNEARKGAFVGDVHEAVLLKSRLRDIGKIGLLMDIAVPVRSADKAVTGVLAAHLMADWLIDVNASMAAAPPLETLIVTSHHQVIVGPTGLMGRTLDEAAAAFVRKGALQDTQWPDGTFVSTAAKTKGLDDFPGFGWTAVARLPKSHMQAAERELLTSTLIGGFALTLALALLGDLLARRLGTDPEPIPVPVRVAVPRPQAPAPTKRQ